MSQQQKVIEFLKNGIDTDNLYHSFLFVSPDDNIIGELLAQIYKILLCPAYGDCTRCLVCKKIEERIHPDIFEVSSGDKKQISIDQIREISNEAKLKPWEARYKLFTIKDSQKLGIEAANSLLKILEEPPEHTIFLLTAADTQNIVDTILSRCQIFYIDSMTQNSLCEVLQQQHQMSPKKAYIIAELSEGNLSRAIEISEDYWEVRAKLIKIIDQSQEPISLGESLTDFCGSGEDGRQKALKLLIYICSFLRDIMIMQTSAEGHKWVINQDYLEELHQCTQRYSHSQISRFFDFLLSAGNMIRCNVTLGLVWENVSLFLYRGVRQ